MSDETESVSVKVTFSNSEGRVCEEVLTLTVDDIPSISNRKGLPQELLWQCFYKALDRRRNKGLSTEETLDETPEPASGDYSLSSWIRWGIRIQREVEGAVTLSRQDLAKIWTAGACYGTHVARLR